MHIERRFEAPFRRIVCELVFIALLGQGSVLGATSADLKKLYFDKQYFELRDALRDYPGPRTLEWLFYRGAVSNKFNRSRLSIQYLNRYLKKASRRPDNALLIECYELLADNYRKTYQYQKAAQANRTLLKKFGFQLKAKASADYRNELKLWSALAKVPPQTTTFRGHSIVDQDKEGHFPLEINGRKVALPFDSGANLSVVTSSLAKQLGLQVIETSIDVVAVAGNKVKARLAVVREMKIGNVAIRNPVFLVFDDHDLYIAEANFQIHGLIGFPVIESLRQITFVRGKGIIIPATPLNGGEQNMCLDGFSPLITGRYKGEKLTFNLDTGATASLLYPPFFKKYEAEIKAAYATHAERVRGVGGYREIKGYLGKDIVLTFSGQPAHYAQIPILTEYTNENSHHFYGNLGQDLVTQFGRMTLNFEAMSIVFN